MAFGDKIAFEDTLDEALNQLFGGDSGAAAGDQGAAAGGSDTGTDNGSDNGNSDSGSGSSSGTGSTGGSASDSDNPAVQKALADASAALQDRQQAYADNDLVAAAEADQRLQNAIQAAVEAEESGSSGN
nr:hypothetical protein [Curtobacterium sp. SL109]